MKRKIAVILLILSVFSLLCGCEKEETGANVVVKARVSYERKGQVLQRTYHHPDKLRKLLMCLRLQELRGLARVDPVTLTGDRCKIYLTYQDGSETLILEKANRFRCRNLEIWEEIEKEDTLYPLLLAMPDDVTQTVR